MKATLLLMANAMQITKYLYEVYKTDELREYLKYLKVLYKTEYLKEYKDSQPPYDDGSPKIII